ncbi:DUF4169 family protein [Solimonas sp. SE-A11]|uniref:DUF4169 family protein n=1 Tax=Solimonas sp. SE-A11 TaxID=3054954 RepID=UPI00259CE806|nr:DUF4169 family protein [Solimonas sp. SE-A11]MDM4768936.1 DUF4169 family protein [Solimonas sp. SE-A11]
MADIINLNKARKRKARAEAEQLAAENRVRFGRTREQRQLDEVQAEDARRRMDQLRREPPADD